MPGRGARSKIVNHAGNARQSGGHRREYGRPAAGPQALGSAVLLRERLQGSWEPQRRYAIGVRSHLEGFGGAAGSWIAGRGDLKAGIATSGKLHQCEVCVQLEGRRVRLTHEDYGETCTAGGSGNNIHRFRIIVCPTVFVCPHCCCFERSATGNDGMQTKR